MNGKKTLIIVLVILSLSILLFLKSGTDGEDIYEYEIEKTEPGTGTAEYLLDANIGETYVGEIVINIPEKKYTKEELSELSSRCIEEIKTKMLGDNSAFSKIEKDLVFFDSLDGYPFEIFISSDKLEKFSENGQILTDEVFDTEITIILSCQDYKRSVRVRAQVFPGPDVRARVYRNELLAKLESSENVTEDNIILPKEIMGESVSYRVPTTKRKGIYPVVGIIAALLIPMASKRDEKKKSDQRKKEILKEYPLLVQKMSLYQATGMTIRNIWVAIYEEGIKKKGRNNPLYQDMGIAINELQSGISEAVVYKRFGERTNVPELVRFTALLSQNLKKGSSKLKELLDEEGQKAYETRKQRAIKEGEEAGTKLLIPMTILLVLILLMIMVPAFINL